MVAQFKAVAVDEAKKAKKTAKKEQLEKYKAEVARIAATLEIQVSTTTNQYFYVR